MKAHKICIEEEFDLKGSTGLYFVMGVDGDEVWGVTHSKAREVALSFKSKYEESGRLVTVSELGVEISL